MHSTQKNRSNREAPETSNLLLGLATAPVLVGLWGSRMLSEWMRDIGQVSEEILRGDRLPILNFPPSEGDREEAEIGRSGEGR